MNSRALPEMTTGTRSEESLGGSSGVQAPIDRLAPRVPGEEVFQSKYLAYRLQLKEGTKAYTNPMTGERVPGHPALVAQFVDGVFRTTDPETIKLVKASRNFGLGLNCWSVREVQLQAARAHMESVKNALLDPEHRAVVKGMLAQIEGAEFETSEEPAEEPEPEVEKPKKRRRKSNDAAADAEQELENYTP